MEGIKALLDYHLDNQTRADHRRLLLELAGEITERLEYLDDLDEDEQEKPGRTPSENANRRRPRHNTTSRRKIQPNHLHPLDKPRRKELDRI